MDKSEIAFLFSKGFTISEIKAMEAPTDNLVKGEVAENQPQVAEATQPDQEEPAKPEKKTESSFEDLRKEIEDLKKSIIKTNHEKAENPAPQQSNSADDALAQLMEQF